MREELVADFLCDTDDGRVVAIATEGTRKGLRGNVVVDDGACSTGGLRVGSLDGEGAGSTRDERDVARDASGVVGSVAAYIGNLDEVTADIVGGRAVSEVVGLCVRASNSELDGGGGEELDEWLLVDLPVVVTVLLQAVVEPVGGAKICQSNSWGVVNLKEIDLRIVAASSESTVATVLVSDPLELLRTLDQVLELDILDQVLLSDKLVRLSSANRRDQTGTGNKQIESHLDSCRARTKVELL